ncbi:hypothetical protein F2P56_016175 [Juglans regia]|uniref:Uncharacterized protein LOC109012855 n=2 Tax=Juglans regia TaxID=51240 RepID=A0A2I4H273_JUGRE|nr:uncharacterized protein LOC109012855 [Juglans regia]XP_035548446.1 uncharacterized protein LOC109012855 [Juglans regia]KAF5466228.1 hypothetical protein F2P56_016175 [Juglans regia]
MTIQRLRGDQGADIKAEMSTKVKKQEFPGRSLIDLVLSWSINDVLNENLYEGQVKTIPLTFSSVPEYLKSLSIPLIKETQADLLASISTVSRAPICKIVSVQKSKNYKPPHDFFYSIMLPAVWQFKNNKEMYEPQNGDLIAITDVKPESVEDLDRPNRSYVVAYVQWVREGGLLALSVLSSQPILVEEEKSKNKQTLYAVFLTNMTTNIRIWRALNTQLEGGNLNFFQEVLNPKSTDDAENPTISFSDEKCRTAFVDMRDRIVSSDLNLSQKAAVISCLVSRECNKKKNTINLIWGPPGTGKTKTVAFLLFSLLKMKCRVLICAPTNTAVLEVTRRLVKNVTQSFEYVAYGLGDVVLYGNEQRMNITDHHDLLDVFLDNRIEILNKCLVPSGWKDGLQSMICLLKDAKKEYRRYLKEGKVKEEEEKKEKGMSANEGASGNQGSNIKGQSSKGKKSMKFQKQVVEASNENQSKKTPKGMVPSKNEKKLKHEEKESGGCSSQVVNDNPLTFGEFLRGSFNRIVERLRFCIVNLCTHLPTSFISLEVVKNMAKALDVLNSLEALLRTASVDDKGVEQVFSQKLGGGLGHLEKLRLEISECLRILGTLPKEFSLPEKISSKNALKDFCLANARLIFCTVSSSIKLYREKMNPLELLVIDEAAQLKECESTIPLQLPGLRQVVLIGDERQLPAMVQSKVAENAEFGRSLFQRLVLLGHRRNLLNVQHRMHPSISQFPNREFYDSKILDGDNVKGKSHERRFLQGKMYGSYSFINVAHGKEEFDNSQSQKNMVEAAVVYEIVSRLVKVNKKNKVNVGIISPYKAQVDTISKMVNKLSRGSSSNFSISVRSVDGFQGGEEDVIIISTVRSNVNGAVGFLSNCQRANVALTRARHCLWIVGNGATLNNSGTVWTELVIDAKKRGCFYNADEDQSLAVAIRAALVKQGQMGSLLKNDSFLFRKTIWKVSFSNDFVESMSRFKNAEVLSLLEKLANGWRQPHWKKKLFVHHGTSSSLLEQYKVNNGSLILVWTVDIVKQNAYYIQILKIWDILPLSKMSQLANHLDVFFGNYTVDMINCCKQKCFDRDLVVPMKWPIGSSSCPEANPVQSLLEPLASLSLWGDPETSYPTYW